MLFSQRKGIKPVKSVLQVDSMDVELRNGLWNVLLDYFWGGIDSISDLRAKPHVHALADLLWVEYFKLPKDDMPGTWRPRFQAIRQRYFKGQWYDVYDFIEFIAHNCQRKGLSANFMAACNQVLEREMSAYRFVGGQITQITSEAEIAAVEEAITDTQLIKPVHEHLKTALDLLSDRKSPDYRNPIKESISAVEAICNLMAGGKTTLGQAIKQLEAKVEIHLALKSAFNSMYGYTSDASGIRHALTEEPVLDFEDAKFMLVSCSGFINYLLAKSVKAGIKL